ncbi:hypothetical protein NEOLEDRAFT_1132594 [Neolentinus lepideus HHB14362 ss-1]|uniref:F-box domain-containing protein n=1 Tax=Neolentinus lepideus HHB14362 ss-1 TaxID=1314782 RepID=A0A165T2Z1_9AGAM|nr:hypothetical protein NEOLEDRAFT_1132594 [Neolentinus lepideus HHB14362 ss-1]
MACPILPAELWVSIFSHLGFRQIIKSQEVCRSFSDIISSSSLLQYLIRLGVYGYVDLPLKYRLNIPDRLAYLQKYHSEWRIPKLQHRETIQLEHEIPARARWYPEKFHDGVLAVGHKDDGGYPPYHEDWKTEFHFMFNQISLFRLDTAGDPRYIKYELGDFFGLFDFDVPEDVLVVARCPASPRSSQVLLKAFSLSQDSAHRRSHVREIIVPCYSSAITKFRVCGELVAFSTRSPGVIVVNWTTGSFRTVGLF